MLPTFTPKERAVALDRARKEFFFYVRWKMLQRKRMLWLRGPHHAGICDALMQVYLGLITRLIINIPPRYSKTALIQDFISWTLGHHPDAEFIYLSYGATLAAEKTSEIRDDMLSEAYHEIFPGTVLASVGGAHWKTTAGGVVYGTGSSGAITGFGAGKMRPGFGGALIYDDPHKPDEVYSELLREGVKRNFYDTVQSRLNWAHTPIILIMQGLHQDDISQHLRNGGNGEQWHRVCYPAINADGTALWPEKHSIAKLRQMQKASPYTFSGQFMQEPTPLGGAFFSESNLLVDGQPVEFPQRIDIVFATIDTASKTGRSNDGLGIVYWGYSRHLPLKLYILDWNLTQIEGAFLEVWLPTALEYLETLARECGALMGVAGAWIEDKNTGTTLLQQARNKGWNVHAIDSPLTAMGKTERCINVSGYVHRGEHKICRRAYERTVEYKGVQKNHLLSQVLGFSAAVADQGADDLLDGWSYGIALSLGNPDGF